MTTLLEQIKAKLEQKPWRDPAYNGGYNERSKLEEVVAVKLLDTKAEDNWGEKRNVYLVMENFPTGWINVGTIDDNLFRNKYCFRWVLRIEGTPASYYMTTLMEDPHFPNGMTIDMGQKWVVNNFQDIYNEAIRYV